MIHWSRTGFVERMSKAPRASNLLRSISPAQSISPMTGDFPLSLGPGARPWGLANLPGPLCSTPGVDYLSIFGPSLGYPLIVATVTGGQHQIWRRTAVRLLMKLDLTPIIHLAWISRVASCDRHGRRSVMSVALLSLLWTGYTSSWPWPRISDGELTIPLLIVRLFVVLRSGNGLLGTFNWPSCILHSVRYGV